MLSKAVSRLIFLSVLLTMVSGCAVNRATATVDPTANLARIKSIYVTKLAADNRGINSIIATKLSNLGYSATTGLEAPKDVDAIVTYADKWMWDITMYMIELTITVRDGKTNFPLAAGNSFHTSLTRKSPEEMVDEVVTNIFKPETNNAKK